MCNEYERVDLEERYAAMLDIFSCIMQGIIPYVDSNVDIIRSFTKRYSYDRFKYAFIMVASTIIRFISYSFYVYSICRWIIKNMELGKMKKENRCN